MRLHFLSIVCALSMIVPIVDATAYPSQHDLEGSLILTDCRRTTHMLGRPFGTGKCQKKESSLKVQGHQDRPNGSDARPSRDPIHQRAGPSGARNSHIWHLDN